MKFTPTAGNHFAGIVGYGQGLNGGNEYEFGLHAVSATDIRVRLYTRVANVEGATAINKITTVKYSADTWYHLKMVVDGSTIRCYVGDELIFNEAYTVFDKGCPSLRTVGVPATFDNFQVSFTDDFSDSEYTKRNWSNPNQMTVNSDGTVTVAAGKNTSPVNSLAWSNYTVEADVKFTPTANNHFAGIVGYGQGLNGGNEYEFGLHAVSATDIRVRLYTRVSNVEGATAINKLTDVKYSADTWYHLKMVVDGSTIRCYVGDELIFDEAYVLFL